jgi:hypothetical protein
MFIVNIHPRERAVLKDKKVFMNMWDSKLHLHEELIKKALKPMQSKEDEATKDTKEAGLIYLYQPDKDVFYDDMRFSLISIRNSDNDKSDGCHEIWTKQNKMTLLELKRFIDHDDNRHITLIWDNPKIPLKGEGING